MNNVKGVILAGGKGKRLMPFTLTVPKPLVIVNKKPLINYNLDLFSKYGIEEVKIIIRAEDRELYNRWHIKYASQFPGIAIIFAEEKEPMGTLGYLVHHLAEWIGDKKIFVTNGDDIKSINLKRMLDFHNSTDAIASVALMKINDPSDYGSATVKNGKVIGFFEKQKDMPPGLVSTGMYIIDQRAISFMKEQAIFQQTFLMFEKDMFPLLAKSKGLSAFLYEGTFFDCGTFERLSDAERFFSESIQPDTTHLK